MNDAEKELLLHRILCGSLLFYFRHEKYELKKITNHIRYEADLLYNRIMNDEKYEEWIREANMIPHMIVLGLWTKDSDQMITQMEKRIDNLKVELFQNLVSSDNQKRIRKNLTSAKNALNQMLNAKSEFRVNTLEGYAESIKNEYIICKSLYKKEMRVFDAEDTSSSSYTYFNDLVNIINRHIIKLEDFKLLSRSNIWRAYWNANKENVFPGSVSEWTDDQRGLVNITKMYDSVYEHPECPNEKVIEDDDMLDGWMILQKRKAEKTKNQKSIDEINPNLKNAQEVFLMSRNTQDFESIMDLNSEGSKRRLQEKIAVINSAGEVQDSQLPDVQRELLVQSNELFKNRK
jgi:hypothetical protein